MGEAEATKECTRCSGRGKYADPARSLVQVTCERCGGSGRVPRDAEDAPPAREPVKMPFGSRRSRASAGESGPRS